MNYRIHIAPWNEVGARARAIRQTVFIDEQGVPPELEWDELDPDCVTALAIAESGEAVGTGRLLPDGRIGRIAVLAIARGSGVGRALLERLVAEATERGFHETILSAQTHARAFYEKSGFEVSGEEFMDAGIPHVTMTRKLP